MGASKLSAEITFLGNTTASGLYSLTGSNFSTLAFYSIFSYGGLSTLFILTTFPSPNTPSRAFVTVFLQMVISYYLSVSGAFGRGEAVVIDGGVDKGGAYS